MRVLALKVTERQSRRREKDLTGRQNVPHLATSYRLIIKLLFRYERIRLADATCHNVKFEH